MKKRAGTKKKKKKNQQLLGGPKKKDVFVVSGGSGAGQGRTSTGGENFVGNAGSQGKLEAGKGRVLGETRSCLTGT